MRQTLRARMKAPIAVLLVAAAALAGCFEPAAQSPLYTPKVVLDLMDDDRLQVFVHSQFGERAYDRLVLRVDNETVAAENHTHALVTKLDATGFFLEVEAVADEESVFTFDARIDLSRDKERLEVTRLGEDGWADTRSFGIPYEDFLKRRSG